MGIRHYAGIPLPSNQSGPVTNNLVDNGEDVTDGSDEDAEEESSIPPLKTPKKLKTSKIPRACNVRTSHAVYTYLRNQYKMQQISRAKRRMG
jgi:hypothetical protein